MRRCPFLLSWLNVPTVLLPAERLPRGAISAHPSK
jgi:hypothetical protein